VATVTIIHAKGPKVRARVQFVVESEDGKETLAIGEGELDCQMVSLMPPTEYAVRHLWPAFIRAANECKVTLPKLYDDPISRPVSS
jgi:hypothetical protein